MTFVIHNNLKVGVSYTRNLHLKVDFEVINRLKRNHTQVTKILVFKKTSNYNQNVSH